jgi:hypothetical protein
MTACSRSSVHCSLALTILLLCTIGSAGCSFLVDDSPYACGPDAGCSPNLDAGALSSDAAAASVQCNMDEQCGSAPGAPVCFEHRCLPCRPHRLCSVEQKTLCVDDGRSASCVPLLPASLQSSCTQTFPADLSSLDGEEIFHVGLLAQLATPAASESSYGVPSTQAVEVAVDQLNSKAANGGLRVAGESTRRRLLVVVCNETAPPGSDPNDVALRHLDAPVRHLATTLRSPAIIGGSTSTVTNLVNGNYLANQDTLLLSPTATAPTLTDTLRAGRQLMWRTVAPDNFQLPAIARALAIVSGDVSGDGGAPELAEVYDKSNDAIGQLQQGLVRLGVRAREVDYSSRSAPTKDNAVKQVLMLDPRPRIIVALGTGEFVTDMLKSLEDGWGTGPHPWYVFSEGNRTTFASALQGHQDLPSRVIGTAPGARRAGLYIDFKQGFDEYYRSHPVPLGGLPSPGNLSECGYDAAFLLAYATVLATPDAQKSGSAWPTGSQLASAIARLTCKGTGVRELRAQRYDFAAAADDVARTPDGCFDFVGASGPVDFEDAPESRAILKPKDPASDMALWCLGAPANAKDQTTNLTQHYYALAQQNIVDDNVPPLSVKDPSWCAMNTR